LSQFTSDWYESQLAKQRGWLKTMPAPAPPVKVSRKNRPLEKVIQQEIARHLDSIGECYYVWHRTDMRTTCAIGTPDFVGAWRGVAFAIEAKRPGEKPSDEQCKHLAKAMIAGMKTCIAYCLDDVKCFFSEFAFDNRQ